MREEINIPEGVEISVAWPKVTVKGPKGTVEREFKMPFVKARTEDGKVIIETPGEKKREKKMLYTLRAHIKNMIEGVQKGFRYKLVIVHTHFPIRVKVQGNEVIIENFLGEKTPRKAKIIGDAKVTIKDKEIFVESPDIEAAGQTAANIEQATKLRNKDRRVFKDGIYLVERGYADA